MELKSELRVANLPTDPKDLQPDKRPTRFLVVDEEGYFNVDGLRVSDQKTGHEWLSQIRMDGHGRAVLPEGTIIEAFDQPLVALDIEIQCRADSQIVLRAHFPYQFHSDILINSLRTDEWDRFYARTIDGVPLVFSRAAQDRFFQLATEFDDESVTIVSGQQTVKLQTQPLFDEFAETEASKGWDIDEAHHLLEELIAPLRLTRCRVLVLGCGAGHEAAWWEQRGHIVTAVDLSESALERAKKIYGERETLRWINADVLKLPTHSIFANSSRSFDIIFENALFCAVAPSRREDLIRTWYRLLSRRGRLIGIVPVLDKLSGPPFGTSEWEIRRRLLEPPPKMKALTRRARFLPLLWKRIRNSIDKRLGQELFFVVEKADLSTD